MSRAFFEIAERITNPIKYFLTRYFCPARISPCCPSKAFQSTNPPLLTQIDTSVRGIDVYVVQPTSPPVSDNLIELLLMISAMRNASCRHVTAVVPYFGYMRSDGSDLPTRAATKKSTLDDDEIGLDFLGGGQTNHRTSYLAMADVARMFEIVGCTRVVTFDLHSSGQSAAEGFFSTTRVENIRSGPTVAKALVEHLNLKDCKDLVVVAPHSSCFSKAKKFQNYLRGALGEDGPTAMGLALVVRRPPAEESGGYTVVDLVGDVKGKDVLIVEDVADTGKTLTRAARAARDAGARHVYAFVSHAVLSGEAPSRIQRCEPLEKLVALNTVPVSQESRTACPKLEFIDVAPLIANLLKDIHMSEDHAGKIEEGARVGSS